MYSLRLVTLLCVCCVLSACSHQDHRPSWVDNPSAQYPDSQYLYALGEADTRETAANRARANLAKIFQVAIDDYSLDFSKAERQQSQLGQQIKTEQLASRFVTTQSQGVLEGSHIVGYWVDSNQRVYSLAILAKDPTAQRLRAAIQKADRDIQDLVAYANTQASNPVTTLRALAKARQIQQERDYSHKQFSIVAQQSINSLNNRTSLDTMIRQQLSLLQLSLNSHPPSLSSEVENAVSSLGAQLNTASDIQLSATLDSQSIEKQQGWFWQRGALIMSLTQHDEVIAKRRWPFKVSATDPAMIEQRRKQLINQRLSGQLYELLTQTQKSQE